MDSTRTSEETFELYEQRVQRVIEHVRNHLHEAHDPKSLARLAHFSPYHFQRVFRAVTGESLAGFVRRLRLDEAARQLRQTDTQVIRIALNAGYETHESFTRAFKARFGVTPREFREKGGPEFWREQPTKVTFTRNGAIAPYAQEAEGQAMLEVNVEEVSEQRVATFRKQAKRAKRKFGSALLLPKLFFWAIRNKVDLSKPQILLIDHRHPSRWQELGRDLDPALVVGPEVVEDKHIMIQAVGGGPHAIARCEGEITARERAFDWLYGYWLPANHYEPDDKPTFIQMPNEAIDREIGERLDEAVERADDEAIIETASKMMGRWRICIPIKKAATNTKV